MKLEILRLHAEGKSRPQIQEILGCTKSVMCYHLSDGQKEKTRGRTRSRRKRHPFVSKIEAFRNAKNRKKWGQRPAPVHGWYKLLALKIMTFSRNRKTKEWAPMAFSVQDVLDKFGETPKCYLTGEPIDIQQPRTYAFDHVIPYSRGGSSEIDNLELCLGKVNYAKGDQTPEEFVEMCRKVVAHADRVGSSMVER